MSLFLDVKSKKSLESKTHHSDAWCYFTNELWQLIYEVLDERREIPISDDDDNVDDDDEILLSIWFVFAIKTRSEFEKSKLLICLLKNGADTSFIIC